jgi:hypothetical protein
MATRTITSPGVQIFESDLSVTSRSAGEINVFLTGFADQGPTDEILNVSTISEFETVYGSPTNAAERYFYHSAKQLLNTSPANLLVTRMPYGSGAGVGFSNSYSALVYQLSSNGATYESSTAFSILEPKSILLTDSQYLDLVEGSINFSPSYSAVNINSFDNIKYAGLVVINSAKTTVNNLFEGYYVGIADNSNNNPSTDFDAISGIKSANSITSNLYQSFTNVPSSRLSFSLTQSYSSYNVTSISQVIEEAPVGYDFGTSFFNDCLSLVVFKIRSSIYEQDTVTLDYVVTEKYTGSLYNNRTQNNPNGGAPITFALEQVANKASSNIKVAVNPYISNTGTWLNDSGLPQKTVRTSNSVRNLFSTGVYISDTDKNAKDVGNVPQKLQRTLQLLDNNDAIDIDLTVEAGLGTVWVGSKTRKADPVYANEPQFFDDTYNVDISVLKDTSGNPVGGVSSDYASIDNQFASYASDARKDHMHIPDPLRYIFVQGQNSKATKNQSFIFSTDIYWPLKNLFANINSSYVATYGNWIKTNDVASDSQCWIPASAWAAAKYASVTQTNFAWTAPAGFNYGNLSNVSDIAINPTQKQRDLLYKININPIAFFPNDGYVIYGQKTLYKKPSAFDRVNVRRLFLTLEKETQKTLKFFLFEPNTFSTRTRLVAALSPIFEKAKINNGLYDYKIVCDSSNNSNDVIDNNELRVAIYIQAVRTSEFILAEFIATRTGVNFEEIIGG